MDCLKKSVVLLQLLLILPFILSSNMAKENNEFLGVQYRHTHCSDDSECPTWFVCNSSNTCQCGNEHGQAIVCNNKSLSSAVLDCYCVTYDKESRSTYLGSCFYSCDDHKNFSRVYEALPPNTEGLINESICTFFNRAGLLCGDCENGYSPFVLSYNLSCVKCPDGPKNWWKFMHLGWICTIDILLFLRSYLQHQCDLFSPSWSCLV